MQRKVGLGHQDFEKIRQRNNFYVDKTDFIREWWEADDEVTLITRPRRFGKTVTVSMVEKFFSVQYENRSDLFEGLFIWTLEKYRSLQGTYPVIAISFADVKEVSFFQTRKKICRIIKNLYNKYDFLMDCDALNDSEKEDFKNISVDMEDYEASFAIKALSDYLCRYYGKKVIILLDEYDTPMQEAYVGGYWEELAAFTRNLLNVTFKNNPFMERAIMTGITRVSKESVFSDLNNLEIVSTTTEKYASAFGFTEEEVFNALDEFGLADWKVSVKNWYDGFTFGKIKDIYNPWSILNFLDKKRLAAYWANTSSNNLIEKLLREGDKNIKQDFECLMRGEAITVAIDEQIVYNQLPVKKGAIWSLLLAAGYLKVSDEIFVESTGSFYYQLMLTNKEVRIMFENMIRDWFLEADANYNDFIKALLAADVSAMNDYMNRVALTTFSYFDTGKNPSKEEPERFYHGFVLGLMVDLADRYILTSNRESGFGRYDVMLEPRKKDDDAIIIEFKVQNTEEESSLSDTVKMALDQFERQNYAAVLMDHGLPAEKIRKYGFAFQGKKVLIGNLNTNIKSLRYSDTWRDLMLICKKKFYISIDNLLLSAYNMNKKAGRRSLL